MKKSDTSSSINNRKNGCGNVLEKALILDVFGQPINLMLPNNEQCYKSIIGSFCTIFIASLVLVYASLKVDLLLNRKQSRYSS